MGPLLSCAGAGAASHVHRDPVKPGSERRLLVNRGGLACQNQESRLKSVLGTMQVAEHLAADAKHQGPMALEDRSEGRFITLGDELPEQFAVTVLRDLFIASKA